MDEKPRAEVPGVVDSTQDRDLVFSEAMKEFVDDPEACIHPGRSVIANLIYGWGNDWSAKEEYLGCWLEHSLHVQGPILECGSGLSSVLVGVIAKIRGCPHWVLEHLPFWASKVQRCLDVHELDSTVVCTRPLKEFGDFSWYDPPLQSMPDSFSLIICDGPPGSTKGGRYGLASVMRDRLKPGCTILLDDADRKDERSIARRWAAELDGTFEIVGRAKPYIKMSLVDKTHTVRFPSLATRWSSGPTGRR
jgi:hypothetical protein